MLAAANRADPCGRLGSPQEIAETVAFLMPAEGRHHWPGHHRRQRQRSGALTVERSVARRRTAHVTSSALPATPDGRCRCARLTFHPTTEHERGLI